MEGGIGGGGGWEGWIMEEERRDRVVEGEGGPAIPYSFAY